MIPEDLRFTTSHEWVRTEGARAIIGITQHAQEELKDIVFIELPSIGKRLAAGEACAVVESVKAAFDIYAPMAGTIVEVNEALAQQPQLINQDCYGAGWFFAIEPSQPHDVEQLLDAPAYRALLSTRA